jgi:hypothetical protein
VREFRLVKCDKIGNNAEVVNVRKLCININAMKILFELTPDQLQERIQQAVNSELSKFQQQKPDKLLTRIEAAKFLDISLPTITAWEKQKKIIATRIGSRVYYKLSDLLNGQNR